MRFFTKRRIRLALCAVLVLAAVLRVWGLFWGLEDANIGRRPHPDEWAIYYLFQWFGAHHSLNPCPQSGSECFFDWGTTFPYLSYFLRALLSPVIYVLPSGLFGSHSDPSFVFSVVAGRLVSAAASTVTVYLVYRLAATIYGAGAGLIAALLLALSGLPVQLAHFATPDSTTALFMTGSLLAAIVAMQRPDGNRFALAGGAVGLAIGTEYHMGILLIPLTCAWLLSETRLVWHLLVAFAVAATSFLISNPYVLLESQAFVLSLEHAVRMRTVDSAVQYQDRWSAYGPAWLFVIRYPLGYGVGFALTVWMVGGVVWAIFLRNREHIVLLAWVVPYFLLVTVSTAKFMRYSAPLLPVLAVFGGGFSVWLLSRTRAVRVSALALASVAVLYSGAYDAAYAGLFTSSEPRLVATQWLTAHAKQGAQVAFEELPNGLVNLPYFVTAAGYKPCFAQFQVNRLKGTNDYLLADDYALEDHARTSSSEARNFVLSLEESKEYAVATRISYVPTFLGISFSIASSPHDWRYPDHTITVYRHTSPGVARARYCYPDLHTAGLSLYTPPTQGVASAPVRDVGASSAKGPNVRRTVDAYFVGIARVR